MKKVTILGSTGSIGTQALDVIRKNEELEVYALTCAHRVEELSKQIEEFHPKVAAVLEKDDAERLSAMHSGTKILCGEEGIIAAAAGDCDVVLNSMMGISGLVPTHEAIKAGKEIALANKETLVAGGEVIMALAESKGVKIMPVDSEHSAIFQCLEAGRREDLDHLILTASGGPFRKYGAEALEHVHLEQALRHPNWNMSPKITVDSATLMNKGLEMIEAMWLFDIDIDKIEVVIHPQSIVHSAVQYRDGSVIAQMGIPDMKIPIALALTYPARMDGVSKGPDFFGEASNLTFEKPDAGRFPCLDIAYRAAKKGGTAPAFMSGANEEIVRLFLEKKIRFMEIPRLLSKAMASCTAIENPALSDVLEADQAAREAVRNMTEASK